MLYSLRTKSRFASVMLPGRTLTSRLVRPRLVCSFSAFLFQVIGNKHVLMAAIQHPVFSAAQPDAVLSSAEQPAAMSQRFTDAWKHEKKTDEHKKRVEASKCCTEKTNT